jgi:probable phosphoglycerate mutase
MRILLTRHGQVEWNRSERFRGRAELALNELGIAQAEAIAKRIAESWQPVAVYTSPLSRAVRTGEAIAAPLGLTAQPLALLNDIDYGKWQGLTADEVRARWGAMIDQWQQTPHLVRIPGGETLQDVLVRAADLLREMLQRHADETVVLVGHDSLNRVLLLNVLGLPLARYWRLSQGNCALSIIDTADGDYNVVTMNGTGHLTHLK